MMIGTSDEGGGWRFPKLAVLVGKRSEGAPPVDGGLFA